MLSDHRPTPGSILSCVVVATDEFGAQAVAPELGFSIALTNYGRHTVRPLYNSELIICLLTTDDPIWKA